MGRASARCSLRALAHAPWGALAHVLSGALGCTVLPGAGPAARWETIARVLDARGLTFLVTSSRALPGLGAAC